MTENLLIQLESIGIKNALYGLFGTIIVVYLILDLGFFSRSSKKVSFGSAMIQTLAWIVLSIGFGVLIYFYESPEQAYDFLTAYVTEYSLSVDNIFVFLLIFQHFNIAQKYHHKVLFYGIFGAIVFRAIFILMGSAIVTHFHWVLYIFGAVLVYTGFKMLMQKKDEKFEPEKNVVYRKLQQWLNFTSEPHHGRIWFRKEGKLWFTTLFLVIVLIETSDIIFAVDSIPAVFSISQDPFIVYTSNVFAIMGLRAMFFVLESVIKKFHYLQTGISFILMFIGVKMLMEIVHFKLPSSISFSIILVVLFGSVIISMVSPKPGKDSD